MSVQLIKVLFVTILIFFQSMLLLCQRDFYAYHTKLAHTSTDYFGKYADLIVVLENGNLEFTRRSQYLPRWVTSSGAYLMDDFFPGRDPDPEFNYTYVRLIEQSQDKIVIHWRYLPDLSSIEEANAKLDPTSIDGLTSAVHEIFTIYPTGVIEREARDSRGSTYYTWNKPNYGDRQTIRLKNNGIEHGSVSWGDRSIVPIPPVAKNPLLRPRQLTEPVLFWSFDEGGGDFPADLQGEVDDILQYDPGSIIGKTFEYISNVSHAILGHGPTYKKGVSGTSLGFDGYYSGIIVPEVFTQYGTTYFRDRAELTLEDGLTIEAWIALDAYPYNIAPIIHQSKGFGEEGFYLGIDPYGYLIFTVSGKSITSPSVLELYKWTHVAASFGAGKQEIYLNGQNIGTIENTGKIDQPDVELMIGLNSEKSSCTDYVRSPMQNIPFIYGIQGMLDELKVYDQVLTGEQIKDHYNALVPKNLNSPLAKAILPGEVGVSERFGAYYKNLNHHELWDKMWRLSSHTDIVVKFDENPASVVYWRGTNFAANWITDNNRWMADQSSEIFTKHGCSEHMGDKQTRHSYARIIENHDARVVIHWRYPCVDVGYICTDRRNWTDEYHTIYPDGTAIRHVNFNNSNPPGFQDIQFFTNPGETAEDVVHLNAMTVANVKGEILDLVWEKPNMNPEQKLADATIEWLNSKSDWKVFTIFQGPGISTWGKYEQSKYTEDPFAGPWNHWPVHLVPSDGRYAVAHDRVTHFALGANDLAPQHGSMVHYGFTDKKIGSVIPKARFWQNPPSISNLRGATGATFIKEEKAYLIEGQTNDRINFRIDATEESPLINPAFVLNNISAQNWVVKWDGKLRSRGRDLRIGTTYLNGKETTIVWLRGETEEPVDLEFADPKRK